VLKVKRAIVLALVNPSQQACPSCFDGWCGQQLPFPFPILLTAEHLHRRSDSAHVLKTAILGPVVRVVPCETGCQADEMMPGQGERFRLAIAKKRKAPEQIAVGSRHPWKSQIHPMRDSRWTSAVSKNGRCLPYYGQRGSRCTFHLPYESQRWGSRRMFGHVGPHSVGASIVSRSIKSCLSSVAYPWLHRTLTRRKEDCTYAPAKKAAEKEQS
jgi:hypothetical protein